jgi:N-acyl-D-aspartate/D-glutamate deacylase
MSDLVIRGGTVIDGTGSPGVRADVAVDAGKISEIGEGLEGDRVLDAGGHVVAPGFIDIHTHYDAQVFWDPALTPSCFHGVTTVVAGNCGFSIAPTRAEHRELIARTLEKVEDMDVAALAAGIPWDFSTFPEYLASVERRGLGLNFAAYIGHTALRLFVMGDDAYERTATGDEVESMRATIRAALDAGAIGFATSFAPTHRGVDGKPVPSRHCDKSEFDALLGVLADESRGLAMVTPGDVVSIDEVFDLQLQLGIPVTLSAVLALPDLAHRRMAELAATSRAKGGNVWPQVTPRPLRFTMSMASPFILNLNAKFGELLSKSPAARREAYADPVWRKQVIELWTEPGRFGTPRWETYSITESAAHPELVDRPLSEVAAERGVHPFDALLDVALDEADLALSFTCTIANDDVDEVTTLLRDPNMTIGLSDAGAHVGQICDAVQATDFLGAWVRERQTMPLEQAVHRLTGFQADLLGLPDRGRLTPGAWADVVVFDPTTIASGPIRRVADFPADSKRLTADEPVGVRHVLVNGAPIRVDGVQDITVRSGQLVKSVPRATASSTGRRHGGRPKTAASEPVRAIER